VKQAASNTFTHKQFWGEIDEQVNYLKQLISINKNKPSVQYYNEKEKLIGYLPNYVKMMSEKELDLVLKYIRQIPLTSSIDEIKIQFARNFLVEASKLNKHAKYLLSNFSLLGKMELRPSNSEIDCLIKGVEKHDPLAFYYYGDYLYTYNWDMYNERLEHAEKKQGLKYLKMSADLKLPDAQYYFGKILKKESKTDPQKLEEATKYL
jgi:hypothetical protein